MLKRIALEVSRVEYLCDKLLRIVLRGRWCDIIVLNARAPTEDKSEDLEERLCEEREQAFCQLPKYRMDTLLQILMKISETEDIFKPKFGSEGFHEETIIVMLVATPK